MSNFLMRLKYVMNFAKKFFSKKTANAVTNVAENTAARNAQKFVEFSGTRTITDSSGEVRGLERMITLKTGEKAIATISYGKPGERTLFISDINHRGWSIKDTKITTREKGGSILGGDKVTIERERIQRGSDSLKYSTSNQHIDKEHYRIKLTKDYSKEGILKHKELRYQDSETCHKLDTGYYKDEYCPAADYQRDPSVYAIQDRISAEYPLKDGWEDMLNHPSETVGIRHVIKQDRCLPRSNYKPFETPRYTDYERAIRLNEIMNARFY